jgi:exodeoxyribonuclease-3
VKIASWNVNGIRASGRKAVIPWLLAERPDVLCLQEVKAHPLQLEADHEDLLNPSDESTTWQSFWYPAAKAGYSGLAVYSVEEPDSIREGLGSHEIDSEGRYLEMDFGRLTLINSYFPNSQRDHARLGYKLDFCDRVLHRLEELRHQSRHVLICGDFNIAHREIDLANPKSNVRNAGFLPEERAWLDRLTALGWIDVDRRLHPEERGRYTWWSYRPGVRAKNIGWRLDMFWASPESIALIQSSAIHSEVQGSDHCPVSVELINPVDVRSFVS